jgi:hypothetical protein
MFLVLLAIRGQLSDSTYKDIVASFQILNICNHFRISFDITQIVLWFLQLIQHR